MGLFFWVLLIENTHIILCSIDRKLVYQFSFSWSKIDIPFCILLIENWHIFVLLNENWLTKFYWVCCQVYFKKLSCETLQIDLINQLWLLKASKIKVYFESGDQLLVIFLRSRKMKHFDVFKARYKRNNVLSLCKVAQNPVIFVFCKF